MPFAEAKRLTNAGAKKMMSAAIEKAEEFGIPITVAIVDAGGHTILTVVTYVLFTVSRR